MPRHCLTLLFLRNLQEDRTGPSDWLLDTTHLQQWRNVMNVVIIICITIAIVVATIIVMLDTEKDRIG